jgi:hypothetical protein
VIADQQRKTRSQSVLEERYPGIDERGVRPAALVIVVALHASVLLLSESRTRSGEVSRVSVWLDLGVRRELDVDVAGPSQPRTAPSSVQPLTELTPHASGDTPAVGPPAPDWSISGAIAAQALVEDLERARSYRPLGPSPKPAERPGKPPSIYTTPKHQLGDAELDPLNQDIVWHSDRCYTELGKPVTPRVDARQGFPNLRKCRLIGIGKKEARGDLFEHLKRDTR